MSLRDHLSWLPIEGLRNPAPVVAVLRFEGVIASRLLRGGGISLNTHAAAIEKAFGLRRLAAVAIVVNSPGGSAAQSALLYRRIREFADEKKVRVLAFAEDAAASGGYWLALAGDEIFAEETSLVGSIGVISAGFGFTELLARLGVERRLHTAGERKSLLDPFLPEQPGDVERLTVLQQDIHLSFKALVRQRRAGRIDPIDETLFSGDVLTGRMALERGLIDGIGEVRQVSRARFGDRVRLVPVGTERRRWWLRRWRFGAAHPPLAPVADLLGWIEARLIWARLGL